MVPEGILYNGVDGYLSVQVWDGGGGGVAPPPGFLPRPPQGAVSGAVGSDTVPCRSCTEGDNIKQIFVDMRDTMREVSQVWHLEVWED